MKYIIWIKTTDGEVSKSDPVEFDHEGELNDWLNIMRQLKDASHIRMPIAKTNTWFNPAHILWIKMMEKK